jgi:hypothetical protein
MRLGRAGSGRQAASTDLLGAFLNVTMTETICRLASAVEVTINLLIVYVCSKLANVRSLCLISRSRLWLRLIIISDRDSVVNTLAFNVMGTLWSALTVLNGGWDQAFCIEGR